MSGNQVSLQERLRQKSQLEHEEDDQEIEEDDQEIDEEDEVDEPSHSKTHSKSSRSANHKRAASSSNKISAHDVYGDDKLSKNSNFFNISTEEHDESDEDTAHLNKKQPLTVPERSSAPSSSTNSFSNPSSANSSSSSSSSSSSNDISSKSSAPLLPTKAVIKPVEIRLNEDGEEDISDSWRDVWHQRILLTINFVFLLIGLVIFFVGAYALRTNLIDFLARTSLLQGITALGLFIVLLSFLGCWGAFYERRWILIMYALILICLFVAQIVLGALIFVHRNEADSYLRAAWSSAPNELRVRVQNTYTCCGLFRYNGTIGYPCPDLIEFPSSTRPCLPVLIATVERSSDIVGYIVLVFAVSQLLATCLVFVLLRKLKEIRAERQAKLVATSLTVV